MNPLGAIGLVSQGLRLMKGLVSARAQAPQQATGLSESKSFAQALLEHFDQDANGSISQNETPFSKTLFSQLDLNNDGMLTAQELSEGTPHIQHEQHLAQQVDQFLQRRDADHDAQLSKIESGLDESLFTRIDRNQDSSINRGEITAAHTQHTLDLSS